MIKMIFSEPDLAYGVVSSKELLFPVSQVFFSLLLGFFQYSSSWYGNSARRAVSIWRFAIPEDFSENSIMQETVQQRGWS